MQYDVSSTQEYLQSLDNDWRKEKLLELREKIFASSPKLVEGIQYKMLSYSLNEKVIFHLNAQKNFVGLYVGNIMKVDPDGELLKGLDIGKGCIRIKKTNSLENSGISLFIVKTIKIWEDGGETEC